MSALLDVFTTSNWKEFKIIPPWWARMYASKKQHILNIAIEDYLMSNEEDAPSDIDEEKGNNK